MTLMGHVSILKTLVYVSMGGGATAATFIRPYNFKTKIAGENSFNESCIYWIY